ncbi:unnamed protein product [Didymodactylos carnosus]|uniref:Uncharacterized protein n=1 Tax=Didymodactylos carnosus TaxID=1234261 RepID=A0A816DYA8_9BILA|nr:unnamed protein product [Didymodactylos carnosus]CAF4551328.1 unnamed protein product [Didymodactylos carnosus]
MQRAGQVRDFPYHQSEHCYEHVIFDEGYVEGGVINQAFIRCSKNKIQELFLNDASRHPQRASVPVITIEKAACVTAWNWYDYLFRTTVELFETTRSVLRRNYQLHGSPDPPTIND